MSVLFIADFFREQLLGGGESNDNNLIRYLEGRNVPVVKRNSQTVTPNEILKFKKIIVGNFIGLTPANKQLLEQKGGYIIYEHDHKYLTTRDPSKFFNFKAPPEYVINRSFYEKAACVVVLSDICRRILTDIIPAATVHSIGCSLWSTETLDYIHSLSNMERDYDHCILKSSNPTKNYPKTRDYCLSQGLEPLELQSDDYYEFLRMMATAKCFIFLPTVLETFSRVCAEAKMLNLQIRTVKNLIGFYSEDCSSLSGGELIRAIRERNTAAYQYFYNLVAE